MPSKATIEPVAMAGMSEASQAVISDVLIAPSEGAFFYDDQAAIRDGRQQDGQFYLGEPLTQGFQAVREPSRALSIGLVDSDGVTSWGDMVSVQYSGASGRDPLFLTDQMHEVVEKIIAPRILGRPAAQARKNCDIAFGLHDEKPLPKAVEYGVSQALLQAEAQSRRCTISEVICDEFRLQKPNSAIPVFAQSGDDRYANVDKMIMKQVDVLPHGLINSNEKFGNNGEVFLEYVKWVCERVTSHGSEDYHPHLHFDLYGWIGLGIGLDPVAIAGFIAKASELVPSYQLNIECPADYGCFDAHIENYARIVEEVDRRCQGVSIVADEYCNTLAEIRHTCDTKAAHIVQIKTPDVGSLFDTAMAIQYAHKRGVGAYCGGTSAETDLSARRCVQVALACQADMMLAKPGMGVDEGLTIVRNEQSRVLTSIRARSTKGCAA